MKEQSPENERHTLTDDERMLRNLREFTSERDTPRYKITWRSVLCGDIFLYRKWLRHNVGFIIFLVALALLYVGNGYVSQQEAIETDRLKRQVDSVKNISILRSCELLERSRQSHIEKMLEERGDSTLQVSLVPPYVIKADTSQ